MPAFYPLLRPTTPQVDPGLAHTIPISNVTELQAMNTNKAGNYYLTGNIDASITSTWNGGAGFVPVGTAVSKFTGTFDGCGYTISELTINRPTEDRIGLFGSIRGTAKIANVTLTDCVLTGENYVAAIAGFIDTQTTDSPLIQNCHSSGTITSRPGEQASYYLGGIAGFAQGRDISSTNVYIYDCSSSCTIDASLTTGGTSRHGGLVGGIEQTVIYNCHATGDVDGGTDSDSQKTGGLIGELAGHTFISYSYATGDVSGYRMVGGLLGGSITLSDDSYFQKCYSTGNVVSMSDETGGFAGMNSVDTADCYSTGDVTILAGTGDLGGFTGIDRVPSSPDYSNCYSIGLVSGGDNAAGFIAGSQTGSFVSVFWDIETSGQATSDGGVGHTTKWMTTESNYTAAGWDFVTVWYMPSFERQIIMGLPKTGYPVHSKHTAHRNVFG